MTPFQLVASAQAPCTRTIAGFAVSGARSNITICLLSNSGRGPLAYHPRASLPTAQELRCAVVSHDGPTGLACVRSALAAEAAGMGGGPNPHPRGQPVPPQRL